MNKITIKWYILIGSLYMSIPLPTLCMDKKEYDLLINQKSTHALTNLSNTKEIYDRLPAEIWYYISSFLEPDDQALQFIITLLKLTDSQADNWVKNYHKTTLGENPLEFFSGDSAIKKAWKRFRQHKTVIKSAIETSDFETLQNYFITEYAPVYKYINDHTDLSQSHPKAINNQIAYELLHLKDYINVIKQTNKKRYLASHTRCTYKKTLTYFCLAAVTLTAITLVLLYYWHKQVIARDAIQSDLVEKCCTNAKLQFDNETSIYQAEKQALLQEIDGKQTCYQSEIESCAHNELLQCLQNDLKIKNCPNSAYRIGDEEFCLRQMLSDRDFYVKHCACLCTPSSPPWDYYFDERLKYIYTQLCPCKDESNYNDYCSDITPKPTYPSLSSLPPAPSFNSQEIYTRCYNFAIPRLTNVAFEYKPLAAMLSLLLVLPIILKAGIRLCTPKAIDPKIENLIKSHYERITEYQRLIGDKLAQNVTP